MLFKSKGLNPINILIWIFGLGTVLVWGLTINSFISLDFLGFKQVAKNTSPEAVQPTLTPLATFIPTPTPSPKQQIVSNNQGNNAVPSRSGQIISYKEFCSAGRQISIYQNELITKTASDGKVYSWTKDDWVCFEEFLKTGKPPLPRLSPTNIFSLVNSYRTANGKPALNPSQELCSLAENRADFVISNSMEAFKTSKTGSHTGFRDLPGYSGTGMGENLAGWVLTDEAALETWKKSPPHNELLLWTENNGTQITKGCVATRVKDYGSVVVLLVGDL